MATTMKPPPVLDEPIISEQPAGPRRWNLRRALLLSRGDPFVFFQRPISAGLLIAAVLLIVVIGLPNIRKKREEAFQEAPT